MTDEKKTYLITCPSCGVANRVPAEREGQAGLCGSCRTILPPLYTKPLELTERSFDSFINACPEPVLAEFWAPW